MTLSIFIRDISTIVQCQGLRIHTTAIESSSYYIKFFSDLKLEMIPVLIFICLYSGYLNMCDGNYTQSPGMFAQASSDLQPNAMVCIFQ